MSRRSSRKKRRPSPQLPEGKQQNEADRPRNDDRAVRRELIMFVCGALSLAAAAVVPTILVRTALMALCLLFLLLYLWHTTWWSPRSPMVKALSLVVVGGAFTAVVATRVPAIWKSEQAARFEGTLVSPASQDVSETIPLFIGGSPIGFDWGGNNERTGMFLTYGGHGDGLRLDADTAIRIKRGPAGTILFSTTVRDTKGNVIVEVLNNHWRVSSDPSVSWDHNYRRNVLEVLDGRRHVVLQVGLFSDKIRLAGVWQTKEGAKEFGEEWCHDGSRRGCVQMPTILGGPDDLIIPSLFEYPSSAHWGEVREAPYSSD